MNYSHFTDEFAQWHQAEDITQLARQTGWMKRKSKIDPQEFYLGLVSGQLSALRPTLRAQASGYTDPVTRQAVHQRYHQRAVDFFHAGFDRCLQKALARSPEPSLTKELAKYFDALYAVDSCGFDCLESMAKIYPGCGGSASGANAKVLLAYEYLRGQFHPLDLLPGNRPDQGLASQLPALLKPNELGMFDKGFVVLKVLGQIDQKKAFFLAPYHRSTQAWVPQAEGAPGKLDIADALRHTQESVVEWSRVWLGNPAAGLGVRMAAFRLSEESANRHRAALRRSLEKQGKLPTAASLELAGWLILITNAPADQLPTAVMSYLYRVRWQIELVFKQCKSILRLDQTEARKNGYRVQCEIWARLSAAVIIFAWYSHLQVASPREISFAQVASHLQQEGMTLAHLLIKGGAELLEALKQLWRHLLKTTVKGRQRTRKTTWENLNEHWLNLAP
jgi:Transposase DDE domain